MGKFKRSKHGSLRGHGDYGYRNENKKGVLRRSFYLKPMGVSIKFILLAIIAIFIYFKIKTRGSSSTGWFANITRMLFGDSASSKVPAKVPVRKSELSKSMGELNADTEKILHAMDQYGTDEETIFKTFESLNDQDINYIYNQFGKVKYTASSGLISLDGNLGKEMDLQGWLKEELSSSGKYSYDELKSMFEEKGVNLL
jgi:hypothetical protein